MDGGRAGRLVGEWRGRRAGRWVGEWRGRMVGGWVGGCKTGRKSKHIKVSKECYVLGQKHNLKITLT